MTFQAGVGPPWLTIDVRERLAERRAAIVAHYQASGSLAVTARAFGISRQRVQQIVALERRKSA